MEADFFDYGITQWKHCFSLINVLLSPMYFYHCVLTINKEYYLEILRRLREVIVENGPIYENYTTIMYQLIHDMSHTSQ